MWFDQSELPGGDARDASIRKQIKECLLFLPIVSANTQARDEGYFRLEWKLAVDRSHLMVDNKAFFFPIVIDETLAADANVPDKFRERQWSRLNNDMAISAFAAQIAKVLYGSDVSDKNAPKASPMLVTESAAGGETRPPNMPTIEVLAFANRAAMLTMSISPMATPTNCLAFFRSSKGCASLPIHRRFHSTEIVH